MLRTWLTLIVFICCGITHVHASISSSSKKKPSYVPQEIIVKFKSTVTQCVECALENKQTFKSITSDQSNSLDVFMKNNHIRRAKPIFRAAVSKRGACPKIAQVQQAEQARFLRNMKTTSRNPNIPDLSHIYRLEVDTNADVKEIAKKLATDSHVEFAQPNYLMEAYAFPQTLPNDTYADPTGSGQWKTGSWGQPEADLWGLKITYAQKAWGHTLGLKPDGKPVIVAVVDTGLDYKHPDISNEDATNVWHNLRDTPGDSNQDGCPGVCGVDDDGDLLIDEGSVDDDDENGYVDDIKGWDFTQCNLYAFSGVCLEPKAADNDPMDGDGHGTHVSGTIAALGNNGVGIIGVAPRAKIMALKALNDEGQGSTDDLANAIIYAAENGADVINNSWGCGGPCPNNYIAEIAVQIAHELGAVVVFAAGNSSDNVRNYSPQNMVNFKPVVVAASTPTDDTACFSNYGAAVDVAAPGSGDLDCPPLSNSFRNILALRAQNTGDSEMLVGDQYIRQAGTSMAAPHVSGLAALIRAAHPEFSNTDVLQVLRRSGDDIATPGFDAFSGWGRINAARAMLMTSVPKLEVSSPKAGEVVDFSVGDLSIQGTATAEDFQSYQLFLGQGRYPDQWTPINALPVAAPVINGELGVVSISALAGSYTIKMIVLTTSNLAYESQREFIVGVPNRPPVFDGLQRVYEVNEGGLLTLDVTACDADQDKMTALATTIPNVISVEPFQECVYVCQVPFCYEVCNPCTRWNQKITQTPRNSAGTYQLDFFADDAHGHHVTASSQLIIHNVNRFPSFSISPEVPLPIKEGELMTFDVVAEDVDTDDVLAITASGLPAGSTFTPIAAGPGLLKYRFNWRPNSNQAGSYPVEFSVSDGQGGNRSIGFNLTVTNANQPPVLGPIANQMVKAGMPLRIILNASDPDGDSLTYQLSPFPFGARLEQNVFTWTPNALFAGQTIVLNFTVTDAEGLSASRSAQIQILAPRLEILPIPDQTVSEGENFTLTVALNNPSNSVTYRVPQLPVGINFNPTTGVFTWTPGFDQAGDYKVTVTAVDSDGSLSDPQSFVIHVKNTNRAPLLVVQVSADQIKENDVLTIRLLGTDPDGDFLRYTTGVLPRGAVFYPSTRTLIWRPDSTQAGTYVFGFKVSDGALSTSSLVRIKVLDVIVKARKPAR